MTRSWLFHPDARPAEKLSVIAFAAFPCWFLICAQIDFEPNAGFREGMAWLAVVLTPLVMLWFRRFPPIRGVPRMKPWGAVLVALLLWTGLWMTLTATVGWGSLRLSGQSVETHASVFRSGRTGSTRGCRYAIRFVSPVPPARFNKCVDREITQQFPLGSHVDLVITRSALGYSIEEIRPAP